jgi:hypothetical protein
MSRPQATFTIGMVFVLFLSALMHHEADAGHRRWAHARRTAVATTSLADTNASTGDAAKSSAKKLCPRSHATGYCVDGSVAGKPIQTSVDSYAAKYFVENYLTGKRTDAHLDQRFDDAAAKLAEKGVDRYLLLDLRYEFSTDTAALLAANQIHNDDANRAFREISSNEEELVLAGDAEQLRATAPVDDNVVFVFVPGYMWRELKPDVPSVDFANEIELLESQGLAAELLPVDQYGTTSRNGQQVARRMSELKAAGKRVILVSTSKGSADVVAALGKFMSREDSRHVVGWINVNGAIRGSVVADYVFECPLRTSVGGMVMRRRYGGHMFGALDMSTSESRRRLDESSIPPHVEIINLVGIPMSGQLSERGRRYHNRVSELGPNDGSILTADAIHPAGHTIVSMGYDHYMFDPRIAEKSLALCRATLRYLQREQARSEQEDGTVASR